MFRAIQERLGEAYRELIASVSQRAIEILPKLLLTVVILVAGVIVAHAAYKIVLKIADVIGLDKLAAKVNIDRALKTFGITAAISHILGRLVYWLLLLFTMSLLAETLSLTAASEAINAIVSYIPHLIIGLLLIVLGLLIGRLLRDIVSGALQRTGAAASLTLGLLVQIVTVLFACLLALRQVGFDISIITTNIAVTLAVLLGTMGLAAVLGARPLLEQYVCTKYLKTIVRPGDILRFEAVEGEVIAITLAGVLLRSREGEIVIPARRLCEGTFTKVRGG